MSPTEKIATPFPYCERCAGEGVVYVANPERCGITASRGGCACTGHCIEAISCDCLRVDHPRHFKLHGPKGRLP